MDQRMVLSPVAAASSCTRRLVGEVNQTRWPLSSKFAALVLQAGALETITLGQRLLSRPKEQKDGTSRLTHAADLLAHSLLANLVALRAGRAFDIVYDERQKKAPYLDLLEARCRALRGLRLLSAR